MKKLVAFLFVLTFSGLCFAQNTSTSNNEEVSVVWVGYVKSGSPNLQKVYDNVPYVGEEKNTSHKAPIPADSVKYDRQLAFIKPGNTQNRTSILFKNNTQKKVTSIEHKFIVQDKNGKQLKSYKLVNNSNINANETAIFSDVIGNHFNGLVYKAEIIRVTYKDGSVWVR